MLVAISVAVLLTVAAIFRPLLFASVDPEVAVAKGVPVRLLGLVFLYVLALTVTAAAQIVGTLLVLSLAITPAAAATRFATKPAAVTGLSVLFALLASVGGILASLSSGTVKPSVFVTIFSFGIYVISRLLAPPRKSASS